MIAVLGATGKVGGAAAAELRGRGLPVTAVVRDEERAGPLVRIGCAIATADLDDPPAVARALAGAESVLLVCPPRPAAVDLMADGERLVETLGAAVEAARPRTVVAISDYGAHLPSGTGIALLFHRLEQRLRRTGVSTTLLRSAEHMQNAARYLHTARTHGILPSLHHPRTKLFPAVSALDVGTLAAELLASPRLPEGAVRVLHVEGPRRYSADALAATFAELLGRPVTAEALPRDRWEPALLAGGLGPSYARAVAEMQDAHNEGRIEVEAGGEVRRGTTDLAEVLGALLKRRDDR